MITAVKHHPLICAGVNHAVDGSVCPEPRFALATPAPLVTSPPLSAHPHPQTCLQRLPYALAPAYRGNDSSLSPPLNPL